MKISELQELLEKAKEEYGDIDIVHKNSYDGMYWTKSKNNFTIQYSPYRDDYLGLDAGFQLFID